MTSQQIAAFKTGAGGLGNYTPGDFAVVFALIVGAVAVLWAAHMVRMLGRDAMGGRITLRRMATYKIRMIVLLLLFIYVVS